MTTYRMTGQLTHQLLPENVSLAQADLAENNGADYLFEQFDPELYGLVTSVKWLLADDGLNYTVEAEATRDLTEVELKLLGEFVSGQNSDGIGEGFEQQEFARVDEDEEEEVECHDCGGTGEVEDSDEDEEGDLVDFMTTCDTCSGEGSWTEQPDPVYASFDWKDNEHVFVKVR